MPQPRAEGALCLSVLDWADFQTLLQSKVVLCCRLGTVARLAARDGYRHFRGNRRSFAPGSRTGLIAHRCSFLVQAVIKVIRVCDANDLIVKESTRNLLVPVCT